MFVRILATALLVASSLPGIASAVPLGTAITYQGQLKQSGVPYGGTGDLVLTLYDDPSAGAVVAGPVTLTNVSMVNGLFTVQVDFGNAAFQGNGRWLAIQVRTPSGGGSYTTLTPRQAVLAAPYALALPGMRTDTSASTPSVIGGFSGNSVSAGVAGGTIAGGGEFAAPNYVTDNYSTVGGGEGNRAGDAAGTTTDRSYATVAGGYGNVASGSSSTIGGGVLHGATSIYSTVAGGFRHIASGTFSTVSGGGDNVASGNSATVPGGGSNQAGGDYSLAAGFRAKVRSAAQSGDGNGDEGTFVWADTTNADFASSGPNQFLIRASSGVGIGTNAPAFLLHVNGPAGKPGGGSWSVASDARLKQHIRRLAGALDKLLALRGVTFEYKEPQKIHELPGEQIGMIAQEVEKILPGWIDTGPDGYRRLTYRGFEPLVVEALRQLREEKDAQIAAQEKKIQHLTEQLNRLEEQLQKR